MANYIASDYVSTKKTIVEAAADIETKLETLDSTTQAAWLIKIVHTPDNLYRAVILHKDTS